MDHGFVSGRKTDWECPEYAECPGPGERTLRCPSAEGDPDAGPRAGTLRADSGKNRRGSAASGEFPGERAGTSGQAGAEHSPVHGQEYSVSGEK